MERERKAVCCTNPKTRKLSYLTCHTHGSKTAMWKKGCDKEEVSIKNRPLGLVGHETPSPHTYTHKSKKPPAEREREREGLRTLQTQRILLFLLDLACHTHGNQTAVYKKGCDRQEGSTTEQVSRACRTRTPPSPSANAKSSPPPRPPFLPRQSPLAST